MKRSFLQPEQPDTGAWGSFYAISGTRPTGSPHYVDHTHVEQAGVNPRKNNTAMPGSRIGNTF